MALTRKLLKAFGLEEQQIEQIIEAHAETVEALKSERDGLKEQAGTAEELAKTIEKLSAELELAKADDGFKAKYDEEHQAFEAFKAEVEQGKAKAEKVNLYRGLLKDAGVDERRFDAIVKLADIDALTVEDGALKDAEKLTEGIKAEWGDFIVQKQTKGAGVSTPPANTGSEPVDLGNLSMRDYIKAREKNND